MLTSSLRPPRGIFIPTRMIFNPHLPPTVLVTWIQLRSLAWGGWVTPTLNMQELGTLTGKSQVQLYRHLSQLRHINALSWRTTESGSIIVSFEDEPAEQLKSIKKSPAVPGSRIPDTTNSEALYPPSYFPSRILGYLSFDEDEEGFQNVKVDSPDLESMGREGEMNFSYALNHTRDQHTIFLKQSLHEDQKGSHACA